MAIRLVRVAVAFVVVGFQYARSWPVGCGIHRHRRGVASGRSLVVSAYPRPESNFLHECISPSCDRTMGKISSKHVFRPARSRSRGGSCGGKPICAAQGGDSPADETSEQRGFSDVVFEKITGYRTRRRHPRRPRLLLRSIDATPDVVETTSREPNDLLDVGGDIQAPQTRLAQAPVGGYIEVGAFDNAVEPMDTLRRYAEGARNTAPVEHQQLKNAVDRDDDRFMRMALRLAELARGEGEVPVGAVLTETLAGVDGSKRILATGRNNVERTSDASAHAEMLCLQAAAKVQDNWRLAGSTLYVTVEPCAMCLSAAQLFRVDRVVYGAPNPNLGACGGWIDLLSHKHAFHDLNVQGGVLAEECALLLQGFFRSRRQESGNDSLPPNSHMLTVQGNAAGSVVGEDFVVCKRPSREYLGGDAAALIFDS